MLSAVRKKGGFTIVELLIVIVVIAILAAITIVAYTGIQERARLASVQSAASQAAKKVAAYVAENGANPATLTAASVANSSSTTYTYRNYGTHYCVAASEAGVPYQIIDGEAPVYGDCVNLSVDLYASPSAVTMAYSGSPIAQGVIPTNGLWWGTGGPISGSLVDNFVAIITGFITPPATGTYTFKSRVDDRDVLYIDGQVVIDGSTVASNAFTSGTIILEADTPVRFRWVTAEGSGGAGVGSFTWAYPGQAETSVPTSAFNAEP